MANKNLTYKIIFILITLAISAWFAFPLNKRINLGLDLRGGMHLLLRVDTSELPENRKRDAIELAIEKIRQRVDKIGVSEPLIQLQGSDSIVVELPGVTDRSKAKELIGQTGLLEFKLVNDKQDDLKLASSAEKIPEGFDYVKDEDNRPILLSKVSSLTGEAIKNAYIGMDEYGLPSVKIEFNEKGIDKFAKVTSEHINERLAIVLDGKVISAPVIRSRIDSGQAEITKGGGFEAEEANILSVILRSGALPAPMLIEEERTIGPLLGADSIRKGVKASVLGCIFVFGFMIVYYLLAGIVASCALIFNLLIIVGSLGFLSLMGFPATLTLPGIAGMVLTLGMAVDANVLINERIREELALKKSMYTAIETGYSKAFSAILDSNVTTLIAAFFLFQFGTGPIRGFALTLTIGLIASMFTAIFVTRVIFETLLLKRRFNSLKMLKFIGQTQLDFIGKRKIFYCISSILIIAGLVSFFSKGKDAYGIDFSGGQIQEYRFQNPPSIEKIRSVLKETGVGESSIQQFKEEPNIIMIRTSADTSDTVSEKFKTNFSDNRFETLRIEKVGPVAGKELQRKAMLALIMSLVGILVYVGFRFKHFNFGVAGVIALFHDCLITVGVLSLTGKQIDLLIVTALLTIAGYSINDTIVIYDRVRENMRLQRKLGLPEIINLSVNQTLSRTILTSGVTLFVVIALFLWGGEVLHNFAFSLIVGFLSGIYSTVYIASPLVLIWSRKK